MMQQQQQQQQQTIFINEDGSFEIK